MAISTDGEEEKKNEEEERSEEVAEEREEKRSEGKGEKLKNKIIKCSTPIFQVTFILNDLLLIFIMNFVSRNHKNTLCLY